MTKQTSALTSWDLDSTILMGPFQLEILDDSNLGFFTVNAADTPHHFESGFIGPAVQSSRLQNQGGKAPAR